MENRNGIRRKESGRRSGVEFTGKEVVFIGIQITRISCQQFEEKLFRRRFAKSNQYRKTSIFFWKYSLPLTVEDKVAFLMLLIQISGLNSLIVFFSQLVISKTFQVFQSWVGITSTLASMSEIHSLETVQRALYLKRVSSPNKPRLSRCEWAIPIMNFKPKRLNLLEIPVISNKNRLKNAEQIIMDKRFG